MARINIELPDLLHKELKINAINTNKPLKNYIVKLLEQAIRGEQE
jgi:hypothetical protein